MRISVSATVVVTFSGSDSVPEMSLVGGIADVFAEGSCSTPCDLTSFVEIGVSFGGGEG